MIDKIPFNIPLVLNDEQLNIDDVIKRKSFCGDKKYTKLCENWFSNYLNAPRCLFTSSCTQALEISALLLNIMPDDEIIMPSYTFVSTANAFVLRGAKIVFIDIDEQSMNINPKNIEKAITKKTKAIVVVHYAGMSCDMEHVMNVAKSHNLMVIEDAAQAIGSSWNNKPLGSFGHLSCFSFHETKNIHCGEGGMLVINDVNLIERAEIIREKGTDRRNFMMGLVDKYTWRDIGVSGLASELQAAFLYAQLKMLDEVITHRLHLWNTYSKFFKSLGLETLSPLLKSKHNGHIFAFFINENINRNEIIKKIADRGIQTTFHYLPLHLSPFSQIMKFKFIGDDTCTNKKSSTLIRVPIYFDLDLNHVMHISKTINDILLNYKDAN